jgi:hypothetical protein
MSQKTHLATPLVILVVVVAAHAQFGDDLVQLVLGQDAEISK